MAAVFLTISPIEFILSAVPVAVLFIVILVYIISAYWREDARAKVKEFSSSLRELQHQFNLAEQRMRHFAQVREAAPFIESYDRTNAALDQCKTILKEQYQRYSALQQEIADQMVSNLRNMIMAPYLWFETRRKQQRFDRDLKHLIRMGKELENTLLGLEHVGQDTARAAQSAWQQVQELANILQTLSQRQIHGDQFTTVRQRYTSIHAQFSQLPAHFINASANPENGNYDNHTEIIKVSAMLDKHSSELVTLLHDCQNWEAQHNLVHEQLHQLTERQQMVAARLGQLSVGIDSTPLLQTLNECRVQIRNIRERARRTEADDLRYLLRETRQTARILDTLLDEINQLNRLFDGYQQTRSQLDAEWQQLKTLAYRLSQSPFLPIQLDQNAAVLNNIHRDMNALPVLNSPMTPETLRHEYANMQTLLKTCQKITPELEVLQNNHAELLVLLKRLKTGEIQQWETEMQHIQQAANTYHEDNYHRIPLLVDLDVTQEISRIKDQTTALPQINEGIKESQVIHILGLAQELETRRKQLEEALHYRHQQYQNLKTQETHIREKLAEFTGAVEQMDTLMLEDTYLHQKAARSIRVYDKKRESLLRSLDQPLEGMLENKGRELDILEAQMQKDVRIWQEDMLLRLRENHSGMETSLDAIQKSAVLQETVLEDAMTSLQYQQDRRLDHEGFSLPERIQQLQTIRQQQLQSQELLENVEQLKTDLIQANDGMETALYRCTEKINAAARWIDPSGWNQRALSFDRLRKEVESIQTAMQNLRKTSANLKSFSQQANMLTGRLLETEKRIDQIIAEGEHERNLLQEAETAVDTTISLWRKLSDDRFNDREIRYGVQELLQQYQQQYSQERKKYERGSLPLESYLRSLKQIDRRLNAESISAEDGKRIDITGRTFR